MSRNVRKALFSCGIGYPLLYIGMMLFIGWNGYSRSSQTVSELSAYGAPTRALWMALGAVYTLLLLAFAIGVLKSAGANPRLRVVGALLLADGIVGAYWPPMHLREVLAAGGGTISDTLHVAVWTPLTAVLFIGAMAFGAFAFGKRFRVYSFVSIAALMTFGGLTARATAGLSKNLPTPWLGVWERINIVVFMLWVVVLATVLVRDEITSGRAALPEARPRVPRRAISSAA